MNPKEQEDVSRTAAIIRTARKLRGKTQLEVAQYLGVSQSFLSKLEHGLLIPSSSQWFSFCKMTEINPATAFETGSIDYGFPISSESPYPNSAFKLHPRYVSHAQSKVREILPLIQYLNYSLGPNAFDKFCTQFEVDPDFFRVSDHQINLKFTIDLAQYMYKKDLLSEANLLELQRWIQEPVLHGSLHELYEKEENSIARIGYFVKNQEKYQSNFHFQLEEAANHSIVFSISPHPVLEKFHYRDQNLGDFFCKYQKHYVQAIASYGQSTFSSEVQEKECQFRGHSRCIYEIRSSLSLAS